MGGAVLGAAALLLPLSLGLPAARRLGPFGTRKGTAGRQGQAEKVGVLREGPRRDRGDTLVWLLSCCSEGLPVLRWGWRRIPEGSGGRLREASRAQRGGWALSRAAFLEVRGDGAAERREESGDSGQHSQ